MTDKIEYADVDSASNILVYEKNVQLKYFKIHRTVSCISRS